MDMDIELMEEAKVEVITDVAKEKEVRKDVETEDEIVEYT